MSKIAELLKLEAKKKVETSTHKITQLAEQNIGVSKSKDSCVSVSKGKQVEVSSNNIERNETSPSKNFTKTPNSTVRRAIPEKYFRGLSKHTYDVLWLQTRGAVTPKRTVQLTKEDLVKMTGLSKDAVKLHIKYLKESGLIKSYPAIGSRAGWEYEILTIEEIEDSVSVSKSKEVSVSKRDENLHLPSDENLLTLTSSYLNENKEVTLHPKTSLKTIISNDDERRSHAFLGFIEKFDKISEKLTGKRVSKGEAEKWTSLADLLILELEVAARRTEGVSSVPAFLTEVLRRQFFNNREKKEKVNSSDKSFKKDTVGKDNLGSYEIKPLDQKGKEEALRYLQEFAADDFLQSFKKWYVEEDWIWLIENLEN